MTTIAIVPEAEQRVVIDHVSWSTYLGLVDSGTVRRGRMIYHCGTLEIMAPGKLHENFGRLLGRLVEAYTEEMDIEIISVKSMTYKREDLLRGFEGDEAYYIQSSRLVQTKTEIDAMVDPPPDLVIEIDITRSSIEKLAVFGPLGVPEVWRFDGDLLQIHLLESGEYRLSAQSSALPNFPLSMAMNILRDNGLTNETKLVRKFRQQISKPHE
ncbi:MAG: Uma2 family endonuclease [Pirellula sp.]